MPYRPLWGGCVWGAGSAEQVTALEPWPREAAAQDSSNPAATPARAQFVPGFFRREKSCENSLTPVHATPCIAPHIAKRHAPAHEPGGRPLYGGRARRPLAIASAAT